MSGLFAPAKLETAPLASPVARELEELVSVSLGAARKIMVLAIGSTVLLIGVALLVLPGPAFVVIPIGLVILGTEFVWARRLLNRLKHEVESIALRRLGRDTEEKRDWGRSRGRVWRVRGRMPRPKHTRSTARPRLRRFLIWLIRLRGSPQAIARGVAIGMIVAFTPTIGFQTLIALGVATLLNANRPVSIVPTWLTNPFTIPPVYAFTYYLGSFFWPGPEPASVTRAIRAAAKEVESLDFLAFREQLGVFLDLGLDVFMPMWIGGLIVVSSLRRSPIR